MNADYGHIPDHAEQAIESLPGWQREEPNLLALTRVLNNEVQELEDAIFDVWVARALDGANGAELDKAGRLLGVGREGMEDLDFRGLLKAAALSLTGNGHPDRLLEIVSAGTRIPIGYIDIELLRRAVILTYVVEGKTKPDALLRQLKDIVEASTPPGVNVQLIEAPAVYLGFLDDPDAEGFGDGAISSVLGGES